MVTSQSDCWILVIHALMLYWIVYVHVEATTMSKLSQRTLFKVGFEW